MEGFFPRQARLGQFVLVYAYEANTHAQPDTGEGSGPPAMVPVGPGMDTHERPVQFDGDHLYVAQGALPWGATQLCIVSETSFAGLTSRVRLLQTGRSSLTARVGGGTGASLFDHAYRVSVVTTGGSVRVALGDSAKVLSPGESWSVVARLQDGGVLLTEETAENAAVLEDLAARGEQASRVTFCNYGVLDKSAVGRPGSR